jgi:hypothetical protein
MGTRKSCAAASEASNPSRCEPAPHLDADFMKFLDNYSLIDYTSTKSVISQRSLSGMEGFLFIQGRLSCQKVRNDIVKRAKLSSSPIMANVVDAIISIPISLE